MRNNIILLYIRLFYKWLKSVFLEFDIFYVINFIVVDYDIFFKNILVLNIVESFIYMIIKSSNFFLYSMFLIFFVFYIIVVFIFVFVILFLIYGISYLCKICIFK